MVYWSRSRQELWRKGDTSGDRQWLREAYYDCDADTLLFVVEQEGAGACHTGERSCFFRAFGSGAEPGRGGEPDRVRVRPTDATSSSRWPRVHGRPRVARGAGRPRDAGLRVREARGLVADDPSGFLLESVEHAERWGRFTFLGRDPALHAGRARVAGGVRRGRARRRAVRSGRARGARSAARELPRAAARRAAAVPRRHRRLPRATTSSARSSGCPTFPPTTAGSPTPCCRSPATSPRSTTSVSGST